MFACKPVNSGPQATLTSLPSTPIETKQPLPTEPEPTKTALPIITAKVTSPADTKTPKPVYQLCSPLAEQSVYEIQEIVSDPYNPPRPGKDDRHHGTDIAYYRRKDRKTIEGEVVQAWLAGRVSVVVKDNLPYGNMVIVETPRDELPSEVITQFEIAENQALYTLYAHFGKAPLVNQGDIVVCGQPLGDVGASGYNIVNPHLHIETRVGPAGQRFVGGMAYYDTRTTETERSNYELWRTSGVFRHFDPMIMLSLYLEKLEGE